MNFNNMNMMNQMGGMDMNMMNQMGGMDMNMMNQMGGMDMNMMNQMGGMDMSNMNMMNQMGGMDMNMMNQMGGMDMNNMNMMGMGGMNNMMGMGGMNNMMGMGGMNNMMGMGGMNNMNMMGMGGMDMMNQDSVKIDDNKGWNLIFENQNDKQTYNIRISENKTVQEAINKYKIKSGRQGKMKFIFNNKELCADFKICQSGLNNLSRILVISLQNLKGAK